MSKAFTSEETPDEAVIAGRPVQRAARGAERPITPEGYRALEEALRTLAAARLAAKALPEAEREGRLRELEHRRALVAATLESVKVVLPPATDDGRVHFGSTVRVAWEDGRVQVLRLVGPDEADARAGRISVDSPLARSLVGHAPGEDVEVERPRGTEVAHLERVE